MENPEISFECKCCGTCCGSDLDIYLNTTDILNLRACLSLPTFEMRDRFYRTFTLPEYGAYPLCLLSHRDGACQFLDGKLCSIHPMRPGGCRLFPAVQYFDSSGEQVYSLGKGYDFCTGVSEGKNIKMSDWLEENDFSIYSGNIEFQKKIGFLGRIKIDQRIKDGLIEILFDFDSLPEFPYKENYEKEIGSMIEKRDWILSFADEYVRENVKK